MLISIHDSVLNVTFGVPMDATGTADAASYEITTSQGAPVSVQRVEVLRTGGVVTGVLLYLSRTTSGKEYWLITRGLRDDAGVRSQQSAKFTGHSSSPTIVDLDLLDDSQIVLTFRVPMQVSGLQLPAAYSVTGPTKVIIKSVHLLSETQVALTTAGMIAADYRLTVAGAVDTASNPLAPAFIDFSGREARSLHSLFTDHGPIAKPALTLQSAPSGPGPISGRVGAVASIASTEPGTASVRLRLRALRNDSPAIFDPKGLPPTSEGWFLRLSGAGAAANNGSFRIKSWIAESNVVIQRGSDVLVDSNNGSIAWALEADSSIPPVSGSKASIKALEPRTAIVQGLSGMTSASVGKLLQFYETAHPGNTGAFLIKSWLSPTSVVVYNNTGAIDVDPNNGALVWEERFAAATITSQTQLTLPTANITSAHVGLYISITDSANGNDGVYRITHRVSSTVVKVEASFVLPEPANGTLGWSLIDYRDGQIADDPSDVVVRVNDAPVPVDAVFGLLGQVVLRTVPAATDDVKIDYAWVKNPMVDIRRLNSREFRLNNKLSADASAHKYRYRGTLIKPDTFSALAPVGVTGNATFPTEVILSDLSASFSKLGRESYVTMTGGPNKGLRRKVHAVLSDTRLTLDSPLASLTGGSYRVDPADIRASNAQPELRDLKYRAFERAYSVALNDPNLLLLNSPNNRIAFPPMSRPLKGLFVNYEGTVLPEAAPAPWQRSGAGVASVSGADLVVVDDSTGPAPGGAPIFWTRTLDLTFDHIFAHAWRMQVNSTPVLHGVFTGLAAGYSDGERACVVGYLTVNELVEGQPTVTRKIGILRQGFGNDPSVQGAWIGGVGKVTAAQATAAQVPVALDWTLPHSYRIFRDRSGVVRVYVDGSVVALLSVKADELPYLQELNAPFDGLQGPFFGSISREAQSTSTWSFVRYTAIPANPMESEPAIYVSYEGDATPPESAAQPWTPVGSHGVERVVDSHLILDSTSATDLTSSAASGLISGDFKGYTRIEPLLRESFNTVLDAQLAIRTCTQGISPNAVMAAIDDGERLMQLCFFSDEASAKISYGGRTLPPDFEPYPWGAYGTQTATMVGQYLQIADSSTDDSLVFMAEDAHPWESSSSAISFQADYILEFRVRVVSFTPDTFGFCGVSSSVYDGKHAVGVQLLQVPEYSVGENGSTTETLRRYVELHSDGKGRGGSRFAFDWKDGAFHTYRLTKSTQGDQVSLFVDGQYLGFTLYSSFVPPSTASLVGKAYFGSATQLSNQARSVAVWAYSNCWRVTTGRRFVGLWKGSDSDALTGYHLPVSASGVAATVSGNVLTDPRADFRARGVKPLDQIVIDEGPNKGVYTVDAVAPLDDVTQLTVLAATPFKSQPALVDYRCVKEVDWTGEHRYRIVKDPGGGVSVFLDTVTAPLIHAEYGARSLPPSSAGLPHAICAGLPSITWGAFDPTNLSQTSWDFVRFGAIRSLSAAGIAPHHEILNQVNVMASYEHHRSSIPHAHANFWSSSEGIPPQTEPDLLRDPNLIAFTLLNEGTPLVPSTQAYEVRAPKTLVVPVAGLNTPEEILNHKGFLVNTASQRIEVSVPDDVLYNSLQVIERTTGHKDLIAPLDDEAEIGSLGTLDFRSEVCLSYDAALLPENDTGAPTPWVRASEDDTRQTSSVTGGALTYRTNVGGTRTLYRNATPLVAATSLRTEVKFRLRLVQDTSDGLGDSQVRFGFSSPGVTVGLAFVTTARSERYVLAVDLNNGETVGGIPFDFYDGNYHTYVLTRDPASESIQIRVEP